ncbi:MAG: hypothetical protein MK138_18805, partial [Planctomycetes bacterium]|nr:hypothetical protein [Planctomycetota bacterium]
MKNLPEINHCSPNPKAWWCTRCKAHTTFQYRTLPSRDSRGNPEVVVQYKCRACNSSMFRAAETITRRNMCGGGIVLIILVGVVGSIVEDNESNSSSILGMTFTGAGFLFIFFIVVSAYLGKWSSWSSIQENKSPEMLRKRALTHRFQPEYENNGAFAEWAEQFLSPGEVE